MANRVSLQRSSQGSHPRTLAEPRRRAGEDRLWPDQRLHQHPFRRFSFAHRWRVERRGARRLTPRTETSGRESSLRPPEIRDPGSRRHRAVPAGRGRRGGASGVCPLPLGRRTSGLLRELRNHARHALHQLAVVRAERKAAKRLSSELLLADARHTQSDVLTSIAVIAALVGSAYGYPLLDPLAAFVIVGFIGFAGFEIARDAARILSDETVISEEDVRRVVQSVPRVLGCHHIRSRGSADHVFLDLHVWMDGATPLIDAHAVSHEVKDRLMDRYPQITDAIIHIEPPPLEASSS